jgi:hypothetical protein
MAFLNSTSLYTRFLNATVYGKASTKFIPFENNLPIISGSPPAALWLQIDQEDQRISIETMTVLRFHSFILRSGGNKWLKLTG